MNLHHLELFYYVARHGGISRAVRHMPYGIQQPAVSGQILVLERDLGVRLFERTPFRLTPAGEEVYGFIRPFYEGLDDLAARLSPKPLLQLRIGAAELILREHLPAIMRRIKRTHPGLRLILRSGMQAELESSLQNREIDLALIPLEGRASARLSCRRLVRIPLVLLVAKDSSIRSARGLLARNPVEEPLISLPASEGVTSLFRRELHKRRIEWLTAIEASSLDVIREYVVAGYGVGLGVDASPRKPHPGIRILPLEDFAPLEVAALWHGEADPRVAMMLEEVERWIAELWPTETGRG